LRSGTLVGFEILARWQHPSLGLIMPDRFVPLAEQEGWVHELSESILRRALALASPIQDSFTLSVNISPLQLWERALAEKIRGLCAEAAYPMERLKIEITETALAQNLEQARATLGDLKDMGCRISLDDFGTGYSSLLHLHSLPIDEIKVDRSFVMSMTERRESRKIVAAVVGLGQSLGMATVAEGVEKQEQADMLLWLGCDMAQGLLYGKPLGPEKLPEAIEQSRRGSAYERPIRRTMASASGLDTVPAIRLAQLQAVYDGAPVGLGFLDRDLKYVNVNRLLAGMHRVPVEEHLGRTLQELQPAKFAQIATYLDRALAGESVANVEFTFHDHDAGAARTFLGSYEPARDEAGEIVGVSSAAVDFTERKTAELRLRQFERVVEGLEEMIVVVDREYRYVLANRSFLDYRATTREKLLGSSVSDALSKEIFEDVVKGKLDECFAGKVVNYELDFTYPDLGMRELQITYIPIEVSGGVTGAACVLRDMTERNRMARANLDWQKRIELALNAGLGLGLWDWDLATNTVLWSDETRRQWGFAPGTFSGRVNDATARIHSDDLPKVEQAIQDVLAGRKDQYAARYRVLRPDGTTCWIDAHGVVMPDRSGHMVGIGVDITDLKKVQESLRTSNENYLRLLNSAAEGIYAVDPDGNCTFCNAACLQLLGYSSTNDLLGKNMHAVMHHTRANGQPYPEQDCSIYKPIREGVGSHITGEVLWRADGTSFPVEMWSYPMYRGEKFLGAVVSFFDISGSQQLCDDPPDSYGVRLPTAPN
jgi:PAS domain S-box-containing protein